MENGAKIERDVALLEVGYDHDATTVVPTPEELERSNARIHVAFDSSDPRRVSLTPHVDGEDAGPTMVVHRDELRRALEL